MPAARCRPSSKALESALGNPERPVAAVVGGAKVSTKLDVLEHLVGKVDHLIIGGGMANTFLAARGVDVGKSLCEHDLTGDGRSRSSMRADKAGCTIHLPYDVVVAKEFAANPPSLRTCNVHEVAADEMILDVGPAAVEALADVLKTCRTLVWNGPLGAFETPPFDAATVALAKTAAALTQEGPWSRSPAAAIRSRRSITPASPGTSPSSRPPAAHSSNGWKGVLCRALPRSSSRRTNDRSRFSFLSYASHHG